MDSYIIENRITNLQTIIMYGIVLLLPFLVGLYKQYRGKKKGYYAIYSILFVVYLAIFLYWTFLYRLDYQGQSGVAAVLFQRMRERWKCIENLWVNRSSVLQFFDATISSQRGVVLNILLFIPMGYLFPFPSKHRRWFVFFERSTICMLLSLFTESMQLYTKLGWFDLEDLFDNSIGGMIGALCYIVFLYRTSCREKK